MALLVIELRTILFFPEQINSSHEIKTKMTNSCKIISYSNKYICTEKQQSDQLQSKDCVISRKGQIKGKSLHLQNELLRVLVVDLIGLCYGMSLCVIDSFAFSSVKADNYTPFFLLINKR